MLGSPNSSSSSSKPKVVSSSSTTLGPFRSLLASEKNEEYPLRAGGEDVVVVAVLNGGLLESREVGVRGRDDESDLAAVSVG